MVKYNNHCIFNRPLFKLQNYKISKNIFIIFYILLQESVDLVQTTVNVMLSNLHFVRLQYAPAITAPPQAQRTTCV